MDLLRIFSSAITRLTYFLASPFRALGGTNLFTPFQTLRYMLQSLRRSLNVGPQISSITRSLGGLGLKTGKRYDFIGDITETIADWRAAREYEELEREYAMRAEKGDYSQIHLTHAITSQRTVCHIGATIGRSNNQVVLQRPSHLPVRLQFSQVNPVKYHAPMIMEYLDGTSEILVDATPVKQFAPITHGSVIMVDKDEYRVELFAWDKLPPIARLNAAWLTSSGPVRPYNEDAVGIYQHRRGYFFSIADGVGGGEAGELISEFATKFMLATFDKNVRYDLDWNDIYREALKNVNNAVRRFARVSAYATAGSTLTAITVKGWDAWVCHVGDSRLYYYNSHTLRQITTDHSSIQKVADDRPNPDGTQRRPVERSVLDRAIGKRDDISPDIIPLRLQPGDKLLLCSDGLNERIKLDELQRLIEELPLNRLPEHLINLANERFNSDNISVIALEVSGRPAIRDSWRATGTERVYVGYDPRWSLRLNPTHKPTTDYGTGARFSRLVWVLLLLIVIGLSAAAGITINRNVNAYNAQFTATIDILNTAIALQTGFPATLTALPQSPTRTPSPTVTLPSSATPTLTAIPPTRTIAPEPTSTLALTGEARLPGQEEHTVLAASSFARNGQQQ
jgi:PPM family protein phosphatase